MFEFAGLARMALRWGTSKWSICHFQKWMQIQRPSINGLSDVYPEVAANIDRSGCN
jgi:hypothetical protein